MSDYPTEPTTGSSMARPATIDSGEAFGRPETPPAIVPDAGGNGVQWAPLLPRTAFVVLLLVGAVVGIAGPILLWFNLTYAGRDTPFYQRVGYLLVLVALGVLVIALPLALGEASRLERTSSTGALGPRPDHARGLTGTRVFALIGVVILLAGAFLLRPVEPSDTSGGGGSSQGGGGGGNGRG
jgi:hypothetical protein